MSTTRQTLTGTVGITLITLGLFAQTVSGQQATAPSAAPSASVTARPNPARPIDEILKLAEASVSKEVMLSFVASSATFYNLSAADVIALKEKGVVDEVITALLKRDAEVKSSVAQARGTTAAPSIVRRLATEGQLDPESYDFWFYHYAYPRALSESYRMLAPYDPALVRRRDYPGPVMGFQAGSLTTGRSAPLQPRSASTPPGRNRR